MKTRSAERGSRGVSAAQPRPERPCGGSGGPRRLEEVIVGRAQGMTSQVGAHGALTGVTSGGGAQGQGCSLLRLSASALESTCERRSKVGAWSGH